MLNLRPPTRIPRARRTAIPERTRRHPLVELYGEFPDRLRGDRWQPSADVFETEAEVVIRFELAGVRGEDLRIHVEGNSLRLRGVRRAPSTSSIERLHQMEISFGPFEREITIQENYDAGAVRARLEDGLLEVRVPKRVPSKRRIDVESQ